MASERPQYNVLHRFSETARREADALRDLVLGCSAADWCLLTEDEIHRLSGASQLLSLLATSANQTLVASDTCQHREAIERRQS